MRKRNETKRNPFGVVIWVAFGILFQLPLHIFTGRNKAQKLIGVAVCVLWVQQQDIDRERKTMMRLGLNVVVTVAVLFLLLGNGNWKVEASNSVSAFVQNAIYSNRIAIFSKSYCPCVPHFPFSAFLFINYQIMDFSLLCYASIEHLCLQNLLAYHSLHAWMNY